MALILITIASEHAEAIWALQNQVGRWKVSDRLTFLFRANVCETQPGSETDKFCMQMTAMSDAKGFETEFKERYAELAALADFEFLEPQKVPSVDAISVLI